MSLHNEFCAQSSIDASESVYGTASATTTRWILLEYARPWMSKAVNDNELSADVQSWLKDQVERLPQSRILFIKRHDRKPAQDGIRLYFADTSPDKQSLKMCQLSDYSELLEIDLAGSEQGLQLLPSNEKLILVCTNGKRDRCCSKFGLPIYQDLANRDDESVWQCTHIGGHRYAATLAIFPSGAYYGQIAPSQTEQLYTAVQENKLILDRYRGRTAYTAGEQAAEYFLHRHTQCTQWDAFALRHSESISAGESAFTFESTSPDAESGRYRVVVSQSTSEPVMASCGPKMKPRPLFECLSVEAEAM